MARVTKGGTEFDPAALERAERRARADLWAAASPGLAEAHGVAAAEFGPLLATVARRGGEGEGRREGDGARDLDLLLGAAEPGAADEGFLAEAVDWCRERGAATYAPLAPERLGFEAARAWLEGNGFERRGGWVRFVRDIHPPRFPAPDAIEVELVEGDDGAPFGTTAALGCELPQWTAGLFAALPGRPGWRCYRGGADGSEPDAVAAAFEADGIAVLALAVAPAPAEDAARAAVLRRAIEDAATAGATHLAARLDEGPDGRPVPEAPALLLAGFEEAYRCPGWIDARLPAR